MHWSDFIFEGFALGNEMIGVEQSLFQRFNLRNNTQGSLWDGLPSHTDPNSNTLQDFSISKNTTKGMEANGPNSFNWKDGTFQQNGVTGGGPTNGALFITGDIAGYGNNSIEGVDFEQTAV